MNSLKAMKTFTKLLTTVLVIVLVGCSPSSSDDEGTQPVQQTPAFTGIWKLHSYSYYGSRTDIQEEDVTQTQFNGVGWEIDMNMSFLENPNNYLSVGTYYVDHIVITESGEEILYWIIFNVDDTGTWTRNNNTITITLDGATNSGAITELTDNSMELIIDSSTSTTAYDGTVTNIVRTDVYYFTRN